MGRKIPGKKHRGVKDPLQQLAKRNESLKINAPPQNPDDQEIPKSVIELNRLRQMVKEGKFSKVNKKKKMKKKLLDVAKFCNPGPQLRGLKQIDKLLPRIRQIEGESEESFLNRINSVTEDLVKEAIIENKFNLTVNRNSDGSVESIKNDKIPNKNGRDYSRQNKRTFKDKNKSALNVEKSPKLNRKQRLKLKKVKKQMEIQEDALEVQKDIIKFGEVVHEPPTFHARPRGSQTLNSEKPGRKNLLLKGIINNEKLNPYQQIKHNQMRQDVINAYRKMKLNGKKTS